jgi:hypothetical protein
MWANFKSMPALLKFLTAQALFSFVFFVVSVIPNDQFSINGRHVTYSEWWSSGAGPFASVLGVFGLYTAWLFLTKGQYARAWYLVFLALAFVAPYPFLGPPAYVLVGLAVVAIGALSLHRWQSVQVYFAPNQSSKRTREKSRAA